MISFRMNNLLKNVQNHADTLWVAVTTVLPLSDHRTILHSKQPSEGCRAMERIHLMWMQTLQRIPSFPWSDLVFLWPSYLPQVHVCGSYILRTQTIRNALAAIGIVTGQSPNDEARISELSSVLSTCTYRKLTSDKWVSPSDKWKLTSDKWPKNAWNRTQQTHMRQW